MSGWPRSSRVCLRAHRLPVKAIGPTDGCRRWQAKREHPHRQTDTPASRKIRRPGGSAPDEFGTNKMDWRGWAQTIASKPQTKTLKAVFKAFFSYKRCCFFFPLKSG